MRSVKVTTYPSDYQPKLTLPKMQTLAGRTTDPTTGEVRLGFPLIRNPKQFRHCFCFTFLWLYAT